MNVASLIYHGLMVKGSDLEGRQELKTTLS